MSDLRLKTPLDLQADADDPNVLDVGWMRIVISPYTKFFWEGCQRRELRLPHCLSCNNVWFYPTPRCVNCLEPARSWLVSPGRGKLYSFTTVHRPIEKSLAAKAPYVVAIVELDEGVRMMGNMPGCKEEDLQVNMRIKLEFVTSSTGVILPAFLPDDA